MKVTYTPAGDAAQVFEFKPLLVRAGMAEMIETRAGQRFNDWVDEVLAGSAKARRVLLWHLLSRIHGHLRLEDVDFAVGELTVERDLAELVEFRKVVEAWKGDEKVRLQGLAEVDEEIERLRAEGVVETPKATSENDSEPTPSPSPITSI